MFIIEPRGKGNKEKLLKEPFKALADEISPFGYLPIIRWIVDKFHISIHKKDSSKVYSYKWNKVLFIATVFTVLLDGFIRSNNPILSMVLMKGVHPIINAVIFTFAIITIFGLHELGHKAVSIIKGVDSSMPYFIPSPPGLGGTLGAVITQREPPVNRDDLFDLGFSGPLVGFLVTIVIGIIGLQLSFIVPESEIFLWMIKFPQIRFQLIPMPLILEILSSWLRPTPENYVLVMHPVLFAAWVGCIVTFINLIPAWQLDGGHIIRSLVGRESHKILSVAGIIILLVTGYFVMAIMVSFYMMREGTESMTPLDDISPLSGSRKLMMFLYLFIFTFTLVSLIPI